MRPFYGAEDLGYVDIEYVRQGMYNVTSLLVESNYRNLGLGTALMKCVIHDADEEGMELWLVPAPLDGDRDKLEQFYVRLGFTKLEGSGCMIRKPKGVTT